MIRDAMAIPKVIHYCWFGGKALPDSAKKCIESWRRFFPDYEIKEWNESNFDVYQIPFTAEAYRERRYAFVSDYARFAVVYQYGGIYLDVDVEVIKSFDDILARGGFFGREGRRVVEVKNKLGVAAGLGFAAEPGNALIKEIIDEYRSRHFLLESGYPNLSANVVLIVSDIMLRHGVTESPEVQECCGLYIYPSEYFCPFNYFTKEMHVTPNTHTIHHYDASWKAEGFGMFFVKVKRKLRVLARRYLRRS